ncbi:MAG: hypothetical protein MJZ68_09905, partial [archaeon]|nr:hypothetical protein [archaeon]
MTGNYTISDVETFDDGPSVIRNVRLSVNGRSLGNLSRCTEATIDSETLERLGNGGVLNEYYFDLSLDKLRALGDNRSAQDGYIRTRFVPSDRDTVNVFIVKLKVDVGQRIEPSDITYLTSLLERPRNDIYLMPVIDYADTFPREDRPRMYLDFVRSMLEEKRSWSDGNVGMSVPIYFNGSGIGPLMDVYGDEKPTFVAVDLDNTCPDVSGNVIGPLLRRFEEEHEERTFLYGVNVKPYRKGKEHSPAWDVFMACRSFNAVGSPHVCPDTFTVPAEWFEWERIFDQDTLSYISEGRAHCDRFIDWVDSVYGIVSDREYFKNRMELYS